MISSFLDKVESYFELAQPKFDSLDDAIDVIIPKVQGYSSDLKDEGSYLDKRWMEVRDTDDFHEAVLYIFRKGGECLISLEGNISKGSWKYLQESNTWLWSSSAGKGEELYDLIFLNSTFFILKKHGNKGRNRKYFVLATEKMAKKFNWRDLFLSLYNQYLDSAKFRLWTVILVAFIVFILVLTISWR
ncbi:MAG: hypothetical protein RLZZ628_4241 [Bacteroidota bacterium]